MDQTKLSHLGLRVLCVGTDALLLETRRMLLASQGYKPETALSGMVNMKLLASGFDLVIVSVSVGENDKTRIQAMIPATTRTLVLQSLVTPIELLGLIENASRGTD